MDVSQKIYINSGNQDLLKNISNSKPLKILDVGCGNGDNATILAKAGHIIDGITLSEGEKENAQKSCANVYIHNLENGLPLPIIGYQHYDVIICSHVIEHICYPDQLLLDIKKVLATNGIVLIALPNIMHYKSRIQLFLGNFNYQESGVWDNTHFKWYTFQSAKNLFKSYGYEIKGAYVAGDIPFLSVFKIIPQNIRQTIFRGLTAISKGLFGGQLIYILKV